MQLRHDVADVPTEEEQRLVLDLAVRIYANLLGTLDAEPEIGRHEQGAVGGTEICSWAAQQAIHRAEWFLPEMRRWKERITRLRELGGSRPQNPAPAPGV